MAITLADRSGVTAAGNVATTALANKTRSYFFFQNVSDADMWLNMLGGVAAAAQPNMLIKAGQFYESFPGHASDQALSVFCAVAGKGFTLLEAGG